MHDAAPERGSVLMLVPAGFLVLLVLAAITFDYAHLHLAQREVTALAEGAANDAVTYAIDHAQVRAGAGVHLDTGLLVEAVSQAIRAHPHDLQIIDVAARAITDTRVEVTIVARMQFVFVKAFPGAPHSAMVTARAVADAA